MKNLTRHQLAFIMYKLEYHQLSNQEKEMVDFEFIEQI